MRHRMRSAALGAALLLGVSACGGDSDASDDQADEDVAAAPESSDGSADVGTDDADAGSSEGDASDDILADYLTGLGLTTDIVSDEEHECMNAELRPVYPNGFPENVTDEDIDALDAAADACNVTL